jgi:hypothetical protein
LPTEAKQIFLFPYTVILQKPTAYGTETYVQGPIRTNQSGSSKRENDVIFWMKKISRPLVLMMQALRNL